jgi:pimeloyl-ACP methyl ester carboxylesterase
MGGALPGAAHHRTANSAALRASIGFYPALDAVVAQNEQRKSRRLTLPVLAIGDAASTGEGVGNTLRLSADDVRSLVIPGCGHFVAEEDPEAMLAALTAFLAPCWDAPAPAHNATKR